MEIEKQIEENDLISKDISEDFLKKSAIEFMEILDQNRKEPALSITIDWADVNTARRLKAFLEGAAGKKQKRYAAIRATQEQHDEEPNVFNSGVKWIKIEE